ncbi:hypothetical protein AeMF1_002107 [Aphanomyces euteiches]|nr:hypothetical protein AeMF1_002107 [Aphanomyces euteiches]KAH9183532.1 hypothetical protein AeNC1_014493 [Aphanomyces euteiches]
MAAAPGDDSWDVQADLHFLLASDEDLHADLALVCDLLTTTEEDSPEETTTEPKPAPTRKRKANKCRNPFEARRRETILELQRQVESLKEKLEEAKLQALLEQQDMTRWEKFARQQRNEVRKALLDRASLQNTVDANNTLISKMVALLRKKPRLQDDSDASPEAWQVYKLVAQESLRHAAIHAIADRQYSRKDYAFINAGLIDHTRNVCRMRPVQQPGKSVVQLEIASQVVLGAPCSVVSRAVWQVFNGDNTLPSSLSAQVTLERLDDFTVYERFTEARRGITSCSNEVRKYYMEDEEHAIVWRSILEDELAPRMSIAAVEDESGWAVVEPLNDSQCRLTFLLHLSFDSSAFPPAPLTAADDSRGHARDSTLSTDEIAKSMEQIEFEDTPEPLGLIPVVARTTKDLTVPPGYEAFLDRNFRFQVNFRDTINAAVLEFNRRKVDKLT